MKLTSALIAAALSMALCVPVCQANSAVTPGPVLNGISLNGVTFNGVSFNGPVLQGPILQGIKLNGFRVNGPGLVFQGSSPQGGVFADKARSPLSAIALSNVHVTLPQR